MTRRSPAQYDFERQLFDEVLLPTSGTKRRSSVRTRKIRHIDIHHMTVRSTNNGGANLKCLEIWSSREASAHYCVDKKYVLQAVYDNRMAWGNGNGTANQEGIIVEHSNRTLAPNWEIDEETLETSAKLVAGLHITHNLGRPTSSGFGTGGTIRTHQSFYATACPGPYFKEHWARYVKMVQAAYDTMVKGDTPTTPTPTPDPVPEPTLTAYTVQPKDTLSEIARKHGLSLGQLLDLNGLSDIAVGDKVIVGLGGPAPTPDPQPEPEPEPEKWDGEHEFISANLAGYDAKKGESTAATRSKSRIPEYLLSKGSLWFHLQECSAAMLPGLDAGLKGYKRVPAGGKGRESYYRADAGITILESHLRNVKHMLGGDTKEFLLVAWEKDDKRGVFANFHNENEGGDALKKQQLRDVMTAARELADRLDIPRANIALAGDTNFKGARAYVKDQDWHELRDRAAKKIDLTYETFNHWSTRLVAGDAIDVAVFNRAADVPEGEMLFASTGGSTISDHYFLRVIHRLK